MLGKTGFKYGDDHLLLKWLQEKDNRAISHGFCMRAALRAIPALAVVPEYDSEIGRKTFIPVFRNLNISLVSAMTGFDLQRELNPFALPALKATINYYGDPKLNHTAFGSAFGASVAAIKITILNTIGSELASSAISNAAVANRRITKDYDKIFPEVLKEIKLIEAGTDPIALLTYPLWPDGIPQWANENWQKLKFGLLALDPNWSVWTTWYEERLVGITPNLSTEKSRATIPIDIWQKLPTEVNDYIRNL